MYRITSTALCALLLAQSASATATYTPPQVAPPPVPYQVYMPPPPAPAHAYLPPPTSAAQPPKNDGGQMQDELNSIFTQLQSDVKHAEDIADQLRELAQKKPGDVQKDIDAGAKWMGALADKLAPQGPVMSQLNTLRSAADTHRKRVADAKDMLEESDRTRLLQVWTDVLTQSDKATSAVGGIRTQLLDALTSLRRRQAAISEYMLAGQYKAAIDSLNAWVDQLHQTVERMNGVVSQFHDSAAAS